MSWRGAGRQEAFDDEEREALALRAAQVPGWRGRGAVVHDDALFEEVFDEHAYECYIEELMVVVVFDVGVYLYMYVYDDGYAHAEGHGHAPARPAAHAHLASWPRCGLFCY